MPQGLGECVPCRGEVAELCGFNPHESPEGRAGGTSGRMQATGLWEEGQLQHLPGLDQAEEGDITGGESGEEERSMLWVFLLIKEDLFTTNLGSECLFVECLPKLLFS